MKCMNEKGLEAYQVKRNLKKLEESLRKRFGVKRRVFRRGTVEDRTREIDVNENRIAQRLYIGKPVNLDRCRY